MKLLKILLPLAGVLLLPSAFAQTVPKIAVTDLAYTAAVAEYFEASTVQGTSTVHSSRHAYSAEERVSGTQVAGEYLRIDHRELGSFSNDIRGALLRGTTFRLVQGKRFDGGDPQPTKAEQVLGQLQTGKMSKPVRQPDVKDIIARIRKGEFPGADYVLFGTLTLVEYRNEIAPIQGTSNATRQFALDLVADYSLINTRNYEIKASFSAQGGSNETKIFSGRGDVIPPNRAKLIRETSQSLAKNVFEQLSEQLALADPAMGKRLRPTVDGRVDANAPPVPAPPGSLPAEGQVMILR